MFFFFFLLSFLVSFLFLFFSFHYKNLHNQKLLQKQEQQAKPHNESTLLKPKTKENDSTHLPHSLLLDTMPSDSSKLAGFIAAHPGSGREPSVVEDPMMIKKKKKKRGKKKSLDSKSEEDQNCCCCSENEKKKREVSSGRVKPELVCLYPFTSTSSATQRKIKQQYDQLVKCHENKGLTLAQVGEFANCLVEARNELQHKSEVTKRKFTITKALLFKADRSSFDRLRQQICKLELEQKRLEEDVFVYNWLQQQLKLSPAYKKMLEVCTCMERKAKSDEPMEDTDTEFADISFEELLAQEKKDSFWQKNGKSRLSSN